MILKSRLKIGYEIGRGHSRFFLLRESWSSGMEHFREFGIPKKSGNRIFGNSVFPFGITEFSGFPKTTDKSWKTFRKCSKKKIQNFQKKILIFFWFFCSVILNFRYSHSGLLNFQDSRTTENPEKFPEHFQIFFFQNLHKKGPIFFWFSV